MLLIQQVCWHGAGPCSPTDQSQSNGIGSSQSDVNLSHAVKVLKMLLNIFNNRCLCEKQVLFFSWKIYTGLTTGTLVSSVAFIKLAVSILQLYFV